MRRLGTIVLGLDVVVAVALFLFLDSPTNYLIAAVMVVSGVTVMYVLRMTADRMGDAQSILDGRQPTAWTQVVAVDHEGDAPRPWSLELTDQPGTYLHVGGTQKTQWRFERGETLSGPRIRAHRQSVCGHRLLRSPSSTRAQLASRGAVDETEVRITNRLNRSGPGNVNMSGYRMERGWHRGVSSRAVSGL